MSLAKVASHRGRNVAYLPRLQLVLSLEYEVEPHGYMRWDAMKAEVDHYAGGQNDEFYSMKHPGTSEDCLTALRGERHPVDLDKAEPITQLCVLRGIRHHHGFAHQLRNAPGRPEFTRALNARAVMSNEIPDIVHPEHVPYCIWYPDVASEETYRAVAKRYPQMRYQVGRACAVAGYPELYRELGLLPDNSIAEEARDNLARNDGRSQDILDSIVKQHPRWMVMNDYTRTVHDPVLVQHGMNGDTAVRSSLLFTRSFRDPRMVKRINGRGRIISRYANLGGEPIAPHYFNITEDWSVGEYTSAESGGMYPDTTRVVELPDNEKMQTLLWNPLPWDLPAGDKDLLILMAAYYGNIDRYTRLRRPVEVAGEEDACVSRGIHHNTAFARWMFDQPDNKQFIRAIHARFIMSNDLSRISADSPPDDELP